MQKHIFLTPIVKVHLVTPITKVHPVTQIAKVNLVTLFAKAHPLICINDKFSNDLVKILHKSVDWFKRYSKNQYLGHLDLLFKNWSERFYWTNFVSIWSKSGENRLIG